MRRTRPALIACALLLMAHSAAAAETRSFERGSWAEIRKAYAGRPVIVHVWGLSCGPCLAELPEWGRLLGAHPGANIVLINGDRPGDRPRSAEERIAKAGLGSTEQWAFADSHTDRLRFEIDPGWQGELPYTLLIARDGSTSSFSGSADFGMLAGWIERGKP
jgi:thiol-disulfide isomerase/thioredoxin